MLEHVDKRFGKAIKKVKNIVEGLKPSKGLSILPDMYEQNKIILKLNKIEDSFKPRNRKERRHGRKPE